MRTSDPVWEEGFTFLVPNPNSDTLYLKVVDQKTSNELGQLDLNLSNLREKENLQYDRQPFTLLKTGAEYESKIVVTLQLRVRKMHKKHI